MRRCAVQNLCLHVEKRGSYLLFFDRWVFKSKRFSQERGMRSAGGREDVVGLGLVFVMEGEGLRGFMREACDCFACGGPLGLVCVSGVAGSCCV